MCYTVRMTTVAEPTTALPSEIERAQNLAAVKALEAYGKCLRDMLKDDVIQPRDMHGHEHVHTALLLVGAESAPTPVAIVAHWRFSTDPEVIKRVLAADSKKDKGTG